MTKEHQINGIARTLGLELRRISTSMIRSSLKLTPQDYLAHQFETLLKAKTSVSNIVLSDGHYKLLPLEQWKQIFGIMQYGKEPYIKDFHDCDNIAFWFSSEVARIFHINSGGVVHGHIYNKDTDRWIAGHFWNIILTSDFKVYFYDLMKSDFTEYSSQVIIKDWKYVPLKYRFY